MNREQVEKKAWQYLFDAMPANGSVHPFNFDSVKNYMIVFALAMMERQKEEDVKIADLWASMYPTDIFSDPPPGEHGRTVDACSARAMRVAALGIAAVIRGKEAEK